MVLLLTTTLFLLIFIALLSKIASSTAPLYPELGGAHLPPPLEQG